MNKNLSLVVIFCFFFSCNSNKGFETIGTVQPKSALEVKTSDLWIGGEVLDRDLCDYDAYKPLDL